jgi:hypothetical protein
MARQTQLVFALLDLLGLALAITLLAVNAQLDDTWREPALLTLGGAAAGYVWLWRRAHAPTLRCAAQGRR